MHITIKNFGAVENGEFDLKPLTVFIGHNNTGKTWTAYAIASLFTDGAYDNYLESYLLDESIKNTQIENAIQQVLDKGNTEINICELFKDYSANYVNNMAELTPVNLKNILKTSRVSFEDISINIDPTENFTNSLDIIKSKYISNGYSWGKDGKPNFTARKKRDSFDLYLVTESKDEIKPLPPSLIRRFVVDSILEPIHNSFYPHVFFLPAERTGIMQLLSGDISVNDTQYTKIINAGNLELNETENEEKFEGIGVNYSVPIQISSLMNMILSSRFSDWNRRKKVAESDENIQTYLMLAEMLENKIINGKVETVENPNGSLELVYTMKEKGVFDLQVTSSFVKDLAPLVYYLRFKANKGDLIVIDEPEMNLHPCAQAQIAELLGMMVNAGLNIIVTTHSPYIVDHVSNLIRAEGKATTEKNVEYLTSLLYLKNRNSFLSLGKLGIYLFENRRINSILNDDGFIDWGTFSKISEELVKIDYRIDKVDDI